MTAPEPLALLRRERAAAAAADDPMANLCVLATVAGGAPRARTLVLREVGGAGELGERFALFFNRTSPKQGELAASAHAATLVVYLPSQSVQYRLDCALTPMPPAVVHESWQLRPPVPKRMDWLYEHHPQSSPISSRERLRALLPSETPASAPASALGFYIEPNAVERLDLAQDDGIHDRRRYTRVDGGWREDVLVP